MTIGEMITENEVLQLKKLDCCLLADPSHVAWAAYLHVTPEELLAHNRMQLKIQKEKYKNDDSDLPF